MGAAVLMGVAVASRANGTPNTATFTSLRITGGDGGEALPAPAPPFAIYGSPGDGQVPLRWLESLGATAYRVKRAAASGGPYAPIATATGTSYVDRGLANDATYYYVVSASNAAGESGDSPPEAVALPVR